MKNFATLIAASLVAVVPSPMESASAQAHSNICMMRMTTGGAGGGAPFTIIVKSSERSRLEARGFSVTPCKGKRGQLANYKQQICSFAQKAPPPVQQNFRKIHGASPTELCQAVKAK
ncbi:MAG: hypothetical protein ABJN65_01155 [Parasphingorhabdus sp.]